MREQNTPLEPAFALQPSTLKAMGSGQVARRMMLKKILPINLCSTRNGIDKRVIELNIEKCFDRINHSSIMEQLIALQALRQESIEVLNQEFDFRTRNAARRSR